MYCWPSAGCQESLRICTLSCRPQIPPERLTWLVTAWIALFIGARKLAPGPSVTVVAASLMLEPLMPVSVEPPLWPAEHSRPARAGTAATADGPLRVVVVGALPCLCVPGAPGTLCGPVSVCPAGPLVAT